MVKRKLYFTLSLSLKIELTVYFMVRARNLQQHCKKTSVKCELKDALHTAFGTVCAFVILSGYYTITTIFSCIPHLFH